MHRLFFLTSLLALPLAVLLFAQWPLRDVVQAYSRQANDLAQILFAVYVAVAITAASMANTHLASARPSTAAPRWRAWALAACLVPWAAFMLWAAAPQILASMWGLEKFSDTLSPGFFLIKAALGLMLLLILVDALLCLRGPARPTRPTRSAGRLS